jgi:hypothetical protein
MCVYFVKVKCVNSDNMSDIVVNSILLQITHNLQQMTKHLLKKHIISQYLTLVTGRSHNGTLESLDS